MIVKSSDNTMHNVHGLPGANPEYNKVMNTPGALPPRIYERAEWNAPAKIICDVHGWMSVNLTVLPHPFCAITAKDGSFELKGLPPGSYKLAIWHEILKAPTINVTLEIKETKELAPIVMTR